MSPLEERAAREHFRPREELAEISDAWKQITALAHYDETAPTDLAHELSAQAVRLTALASPHRVFSRYETTIKQMLKAARLLTQLSDESYLPLIAPPLHTWHLNLDTGEVTALETDNAETHIARIGATSPSGRGRDIVRALAPLLAAAGNPPDTIAVGGGITTVKTVTQLATDTMEDHLAELAPTPTGFRVLPASLPDSSASSEHQALLAESQRFTRVLGELAAAGPTSLPAVEGALRQLGTEPRTLRGTDTFADLQALRTTLLYIQTGYDAQSIKVATTLVVDAATGQTAMCRTTAGKDGDTSEMVTLPPWLADLATPVPAPDATNNRHAETADRAVTARQETGLTQANAPQWTPSDGPQQLGQVLAHHLARFVDEEAGRNSTPPLESQVRQALLRAAPYGPIEPFQIVIVTPPTLSSKRVRTYIAATQLGFATQTARKRGARSTSREPIYEALPSDPRKEDEAIWKLGLTPPRVMVDGSMQKMGPGGDEETATMPKKSATKTEPHKSDDQVAMRLGIDIDRPTWPRTPHSTLIKHGAGDSNEIDPHTVLGIIGETEPHPHDSALHDLVTRHPLRHFWRSEGADARFIGVVEPHDGVTAPAVVAYFRNPPTRPKSDPEHPDQLTPGARGHHVTAQTGPHPLPVAVVHTMGRFALEELDPLWETLGEQSDKPIRIVVAADHDGTNELAELMSRNGDNRLGNTEIVAIITPTAALFRDDRDTSYAVQRSSALGVAIPGSVALISPQSQLSYLSPGVLEQVEEACGHYEQRRAIATETAAKQANMPERESALERVDGVNRARIRELLHRLASNHPSRGHLAELMNQPGCVVMAKIDSAEGRVMFALAPEITGLQEPLTFQPVAPQPLDKPLLAGVSGRGGTVLLGTTATNSLPLKPLELEVHNLVAALPRAQPPSARQRIS